MNKVGVFIGGALSLFLAFYFGTLVVLTSMDEKEPEPVVERLNQQLVAKKETPVLLERKQERDPIDVAYMLHRRRKTWVSHLYRTLHCKECGKRYVECCNIQPDHSYFQDKYLDEYADSCCRSDGCKYMIKLTKDVAAMSDRTLHKQLLEIADREAAGKPMTAEEVGTMVHDVDYPKP